jgi:hypothetical protein
MRFFVTFCFVIIGFGLLKYPSLHNLFYCSRAGASFSLADFLTVVAVFVVQFKISRTELLSRSKRKEGKMVSVNPSSLPGLSHNKQIQRTANRVGACFSSCSASRLLVFSGLTLRCVCVR